MTSKFSRWRHYFCWRQQFCDDVIKNPTHHKNDDNFCSTNRRKMVDPSFYRYYIAAFTKWWMEAQVAQIFADVSSIWVQNSKMTSRHVTSHRRIFTKISENVSLISIMFVSKDEIICIIQTKIMSNNVFSGLIWKSIGKLYLPSTKPP